MVYSRVSTSTLVLLLQVYSYTLFTCICDFSHFAHTGILTSAVMYFTLDSEANEDPPEFTLTCQSKGGPATEVVWMRNGVRVEEDSNHTTSQIIVDTSGNTVYNNTLRVRGREGGRYYVCRVQNNRYEYFQSFLQEVSHIILGRSVMKYFGRYNIFILAAQQPVNLSATYKTPTSISLKWKFTIRPLYVVYSYVVYYESGGRSHSVSFRGEYRERDNSHILTDLPVGGIHNISLVALVHLPSHLAGPVSPGMSIHNT